MTASPNAINVTRYTRQVVIDRVVERLCLILTPAEKAQLSAAQVLVTGSLGFFGRYVVDVLLEWWGGSEKSTGHVYAMDTAQVPFEVWTERWRAPRYNAYLSTLRHDVIHRFGEFPHPLTHVWHLAGIASPYWYERKPFETIEVTVDGVKAMLQLALEDKARFLFTSSSEVYQTATEVPTPESYTGAIPTRTKRSCYDVSKALGETLTWLGHHHLGLHAGTVRIFNAFGPGLVETDRRILTRLGSALVGRYAPTIYVPADGVLPTRTYTPVANTLLGFFLVALRGTPDGIYNVGLSAPEVDVRVLIELARRSGAAELPEALQVRPPSNYQTEPLRRCPDITALKALGFTPCMPLSEGLELFFEYARATYKGLP